MAMGFFTGTAVHAPAPPAGFVALRMLPRSSPTTHSVGLGHETEWNSDVPVMLVGPLRLGSTEATVQAPSNGVVVVRMLPPPSTATPLGRRRR